MKKVTKKTIGQNYMRDELLNHAFKVKFINGELYALCEYEVTYICLQEDIETVNSYDFFKKNNMIAYVPFKDTRFLELENEWIKIEFLQFIE